MTASPAPIVTSSLGGGEVLRSGWLAYSLDLSAFASWSLLEGKQEPVDVRRVRWFAGSV